MAEVQEQRSQRGCLFWGCLTIFLVGFLIVGAGGVFVYYAYQKYDRLVATEPRELPKHESQPAVYQKLREEIDAFSAPDGAASTEALELSAADLNTLLFEAAPQLQDKLYVRLQDGAAHVDVSYPMTDLAGAWGGWFADRYLNGTMVVRPATADGEVGLEMESVTLNGVDATEEVGPLLRQALEEGREDFERVLRSAKRFEIRGDKVILGR